MNPQSPQFNITELINFYHTNQLPIPETFKKIDFLEISEKNVDAVGYVSFIRQSLAINIIKNLPFEAYKDLFSLRWFRNDGHRNETFCSIIEAKSFDTLSHCFNLIEKLNIDTREYAKVKKNILIPLVEAFDTFEFHKLNYNRAQLSEFFLLWNKSFDIIELKEGSIKSLKKNKKTKSILKNMAKSAIYFDAFKTIFEMLHRDIQQEYSTDFLMETALCFANRKLVDYFEKKNLCIDNNYIKALKNIFSIEENFSEKDPLTPASKLWLYSKIKDKLINVEPYYTMGLLDYFKDNNILVNDIIAYNPHIKTGNLFDEPNTSLLEINFLLNIAKKMNYQDEHFLTFQPIRKIIELLPLINEKFNVNTTEPYFSPMKQGKIFDNLINSIRNGESSEANKKTFNQLRLELSLQDKKTTAKIKI